MIQTGDYLNQLKALMDFYDTTGAGGPRDGGMGMNAANYNGDRLNFAMNTLNRLQGPQIPNQGQMPNFFPTDSGPNPQYPHYGNNEAIPPEVIAQKQGFPIQPRPQVQQPSQLPPRSPNYLMQLLGR